MVWNLAACLMEKFSVKTACERQLDWSFILMVKMFIFKFMRTETERVVLWPSFSSWQTWMYSVKFVNPLRLEFLFEGRVTLQIDQLQLNSIRCFLKVGCKWWWRHIEFSIKFLEVRKTTTKFITQCKYHIGELFS